MNIDTIRLPPPILQYNSTSDRQIVFKIQNKYDDDFYTNKLINNLKHIHLSNPVNTNDIKDSNKYQKVKIIGEDDFKNIN